MSFSSDVKEELAKRIGTSRHCRLAEIAAIVNSAGYVEQKNGKPIMLYLQPDNEAVIRKFFTLIKKAFNIGTSFLEESPDIKVNGRVYRPVLGEGELLESCLKAIRVI
ncbi:MAG: DNA-binding protein WhiA, partial [Butyrivibrio sp.]|nr:DNA-binding protein WhiA [Butyrivibrio sp.]